MKRRLEYFEDQLDQSSMGREVIATIENHAEEVMHLIAHNRHVMVAWNRNKGPAFIKSFMDSGFETDLAFTKELDGIRIEKLLMAISEALMDYGSADLKQSIGKYASLVFRVLDSSNSLVEIIDRIKESENTNIHS